MPLQHYGVLKGRPVEGQTGTTHSPHFQIHLIDEDTQTDYRIAVNVLSSVKPYNLLYHVEDNFIYPTTPALLQLPQGFTPIVSEPNGLAIDFTRSEIVDPEEMKPVQFTDIGTEGVLNNLLDIRVQEAIADPDAFIFAFGDRWGPEENLPDQYFHFTPGNGIHNIHMNQGNDPSHQDEDGVWQDGALMIYLPSQNHWMAMLLKFQSQSWNTDDTTGHAL